MHNKKFLIFALISLFVTANFSCISLFPDVDFEEYTLTVKPNIIIFDEDIVYQGLSRLPIQMTIVKRDQDGNFGYEDSVYGETNSAGVFASPKSWDFSIESTSDEIWINVYEDNGAFIGSCKKKYSEYRDRTIYYPDCVFYY